MTELISRKTRWLSWSSFVFALLQSLCTAVFAINGIRVFISVGALAAALGTGSPAARLHRDAIRIPMMVLSLAGVVINLYMIWKVRRLRSRPAAQWRAQPIPARELRSERWQIALAILTLVLLAAEWSFHIYFHHPHHG